MANAITSQSADTLSGVLGSMVDTVPTEGGAPLIDPNAVPDRPGETTSITYKDQTLPEFTLTTPEAKALPAPTTASELDTFLADWQKNKLESTQSWSDYVTSAEGEAAAAGLKEQAMPEPLPEAPSLLNEYQKMRESYGLDDLEASLNDLKAQEREQQAIRRERIANTYGSTQRMSAIQGQVSEVERQEMERLDFINREIQAKTDIINSAYNIINITTELMNTDWQNAKAQWQMEFDANMTIYKQLRSDFESDRTALQQQIEYQQDSAKANLQIYMNMITNGQMFYDTLDDATKTEITKLEVQSGLGKGFIANLQMDPDKKVKSITTRNEGTTKYADILQIDPRTGAISVKTVKLGREYSVSSGGSSTATKAAEQLAADRAGASSKLAAKAGGDGRVSPETWNIVRSEWLGLGYTSDQFNSYFGQFVNTTHAQDYAGYASTGTSMGGQTGGVTNNKNYGTMA